MNRPYTNFDEALTAWGEYRRRKTLQDRIRDSRDNIDTSIAYDRRGHRYVLRILLISSVILLATSLLVGAAVVGLRALLQEAAQLRQRLDAVQQAVGLDKSFTVTFDVEQPRKARLAVSIDPGLVRQAEVSYDEGATWRKLYEGGELAPTERLLALEDEHAFTPPAAGQADVSARVRVSYAPAVLQAFPEYASAEKTERAAEYEISGREIRMVSAAGAAAAPASTEVPRAAAGWEMTNSPKATIDCENDAKDGALLARFTLNEVGEWATLGHSIPGAAPANPTASLEGLTAIEVQLAYDNPSQIALEAKLIDDAGKMTGTIKFIEPAKTSQTVRIPAKVLKPYFGVPRVDLGRIRRLELTLARKMPGQAGEGAVRIEKVSLISTAALPQAWSPPAAYAQVDALSLKPDFWQTAKSAQAEIALAAEGELLACKVRLPYEAGKDKELPWTSVSAQVQGKSYREVQAIEIELKWDAAAPITIEPQLVTGTQGDVYGQQRRIRPAAEFQKVMVYPQDLKYFYTFGGERSDKGLDLAELKAFHLGVARKAVNQAEGGTLCLKSVRFLAAQTPDK